MTNRERVLASLRHEQPDRVPYHIQFTLPAREKMIEHTGDPNFESKLGNCFTLLKCHPYACWREVEPGIIEDHFGMRWDRRIDKDIGTVCNQVLTPENAREYPFPDPSNPVIWAPFEATTRAKGDAFVVAQIGFSLFERAWGLAGMEDILAGMISDPEFVNVLLDRILDYNLQVIRRACAYDIDAMLFGDDWGCQRGVLMGPSLWREFILPRVRRMYGELKDAGKVVFIHCCGKVEDLFPDLIAAGLDVFNPFQPEVMDVFEVKRKFGNQLCFYGGISTQRTLPFATPDQTREEVKRLLVGLGHRGGYFAAPAHAIPKDARPENISAMIDVLQSQ